MSILQNQHENHSTDPTKGQLHLLAVHEDYASIYPWILALHDNLHFYSKVLLAVLPFLFPCFNLGMTPVSCFDDNFINSESYSVPQKSMVPESPPCFQAMAAQASSLDGIGIPLP